MQAVHARDSGKKTLVRARVAHGLQTESWPRAELWSVGLGRNGSFQVENHKIGKSVEEEITYTRATHRVAQTSSLDLSRAP